MPGSLVPGVEPDPQHGGAPAPFRQMPIQLWAIVALTAAAVKIGPGGRFVFVPLATSGSVSAGGGSSGVCSTTGGASGG